MWTKLKSGGSEDAQEGDANMLSFSRKNGSRLGLSVDGYVIRRAELKREVPEVV